MRLKYYFPISAAVFFLVVGLIFRSPLPVLPFAVILLFGETLLGFQVEDGKVLHFVEDFWKALKTGH